MDNSPPPSSATDPTALDLLFAACREGDAEQALELLQRTKAVNSLDAKGDTPLIAVCGNGHLDLASALLELGADVEATNVDGATALWVAAQKGHKEVATLLLDHQANVDAANGNGVTPLCIATFVGHFEVMRLLLKCKANVNAAASTGPAPLSIAAQCGNVDAVKLLLEYQANLNVPIPTGESPLMLAVNNDRVEVASLLLERQADVDAATMEGVTSLYAASRAGSADLMKMLLEHHANVHATDRYGRTPLFVAAQSGHADAVKLLLENRANVDATNMYGQPPLWSAAEKGHVDVVAALLEYQANIEMAYMHGATPLWVAVREGHLLVVELLLKHQAKVDAADLNRMTPLLVAAVKGYAEVAEVLLVNKANVNATNANGVTALSFAVQQGYARVVSVLLKHHADTNVKSPNEATLLYNAAQHGHADIVTTLLQLGADVDAATDKGTTPLCAAAQRGDVRIASVLLKYGANVASTTVTGMNPLLVAAQDGHADVVSVLLGHNANVEAANVSGMTALSLAAHFGHLDVVLTLLNHHADVDATHQSGKTPLCAAARNGHGDIVSTLLEHGATVDATNAVGWTPLLLAAAIGCTPVVTVLLQHSANVHASIANHVTSLYLAAQYGHADVVNVLLDYHADVESAAMNGATPLCISAQTGHAEVVSVLLKRGARLEAETADGATSLLYAALVGNVQVAAVLLQHHASVNATTLNGTTPLWIAARKGHSNLVSLLLRYQASVAATHEDGTTPLHVAAQHGHLEVVKKLLGERRDVDGTRSDAWIDTVDAKGDTPLLAAGRMGYFEVVKTLLSAGASAHVRAGDGSTVLFLAAQQRNVKAVTQLFEFGCLEPGNTSDGQPGLLCASLQTMREHAPQKHEFQTMWKRLADRLMSVYLHFQEAPDSFRASGYPFVMILFHVVQSQRACSADNVTTRLVASPSIVSRFRDFHTDITFLERAVGPCLFDSKRLEWEKQCRSDESALLELFRENVEDAASLALSLNNEADQVEAATLLQHKLLAQGAMCTPELLQLLELFESRVLEIFNVAVPKIPEWFIPTHELDADVTTSSSDEIAAAAILRGRWLPNSAVVLGEYQMQRGEFMMNVERCCSLSHPNVAKVYGASHLRSPFTAVFESTSSTNLREYLSREENKPGLWQRLLEVALGLKYLIERGVIVTVLRCGDIWVGTDGVAKINTLGCLAAQANAERGVQHARWLAPEIIRGEPPTVGSAIFSLAMCAWEALTAEVPWGPREMDDVIASQVVRGFRPPRFEGMADTEFNLIERMWLSDSSKRPPPAIAVQRLQHIVDEQSSTDANHSQDQSEPAMSNIGTGILDLQHFEFYDLGASIPYFLETLEFKCDQCRESQDAVQHILKRLHAVFTVIQSQNQLPNDVAVAGYRELLMKFNKFLGNAYKASSVLLLIKSQKVSLQSNVFHRWLDELLELLAPATSDPVHIWIPEAPVYDNVPETDSGDEKHAASPGLSKAELNPVEQAPQAGPIKIRRFPCDRLNERFQELDFAAIEVVDSDGNASRLPWLMHTYDLKYDRKSPIGVGAFGEVYRATWLGTPVVVKFMGFEADGDAYSRDLFFHELRVWFPLSHPHVIKLYGACHIGKRFFACEYAGNGTLSKFLKHSTIASDIRYCWALLCQVACGLQYLHELNILHNDLKCDNVLISTDGTAKVTDFGLSCILNSAEVLVDPRKQGAQQWKSPESLRGDRLTLASDVYAFAMCILEAVTGEPPWGCNIVDAGVRYQIKNGNFPLQPSRLSKTQWKLIEMMCVSEPAQRVHISFVAEKLGEFSQQQQLVPSLEAAAVSDAP